MISVFSSLRFLILTNWGLLKYLQKEHCFVNFFWPIASKNISWKPLTLSQITLQKLLLVWFLGGMKPWEPISMFSLEFLIRACALSKHDLDKQYMWQWTRIKFNIKICSVSQSKISWLIFHIPKDINQNQFYLIQSKIDKFCRLFMPQLSLETHQFHRLPSSCNGA